jgi:uncharacterized membrane protein required for colicin V production
LDLLDVIVILVAVMAAIGGYRLGFVGRVASWLGLGLGLYVAIRLLPTVLLHLSSASPGAQLAVSVLVLVGGALLGQAVGLLVGARLHRALPLGPVRQVDHVVGAGVGIVGVVVALWLLLPSIAAVPGWPARATANSGISRWVSVHLPPPPDALQILRRLIGQDAPQVFAVLHPGAAAGTPPSVSSLPTAVTRAVAASTVKVQGEACNRIYEGSGFAVGADMIVTNAHVVAGEPPGQTSVLLPSGVRRAARVVMFDPRRDLALLSVPSLGEPPLTLLVAHAGATGAVFGHPNGQNALAVTPARIAREEGRSAATSTIEPTPSATSWYWPPRWLTATPEAHWSTRPDRSSGLPSPSRRTSPAPPMPSAPPSCALPCSSRAAPGGHPPDPA